MAAAMKDESPKKGDLNRERDELYRYIVESATDYAIFSANLDRQITSWNAGCERLMGWSEEEAVGQSADIIFTAEDRDNGIPDMEVSKAITEGQAENKRWHLRKDGSRFWGDGLMLQLNDEMGKTLGFLKIFRDRTAELEADEARKDADRRKDEFLAILAHELRNPLAAIGNAAQLALRESVDLEALQWSKEVIGARSKTSRS